MSTNEHVKVLEPMADTMDKFRALSASLKADAAALRRDGVYRCCAGSYEHAAAHIDAIVRESDAQVPVAATLDDAAADPALTLDVARELLRDAAAGIRSLAASAERTEPAEGREAVAEIIGWNNDATPRLRINTKLHNLPAGTELYTTPPAGDGAPQPTHSKEAAR